jgi:negative regulator of sigma-B (phosphoserine phosphatase)
MMTNEKPLEWGHASSPHPGQSSTGDLHLVIDRPHGALVCVMDGLGHGPEASQAVETAAEVLRKSSAGSLPTLIEVCHHALRNSRGIAMTLADIDADQGELSWAGIGNVEGRLLRASPAGDRRNESTMLRGGVVGYQIPLIRPSTLNIFPGDLLIFATDGISPSFGDGVILSDPPQRIAERIMSQHNHNKDDALVVVGKFSGPAS